jgi:hypothetical protein
MPPADVNDPCTARPRAVAPGPQESRQRPNNSRARQIRSCAAVMLPAVGLSLQEVKCCAAQSPWVSGGLFAAQKMQAGGVGGAKGLRARGR